MATRLSGRIKTLVGDRGHVVIELDNNPELGPKGNIWFLQKDHRNFNALFSLALAAASNRWKITIRIEGDSAINSEVDANIKSIGVAF